MLLAHIGQLFDKTEAQSVGIKREVGNPPQPTILATLPSPVFTFAVNHAFCERFGELPGLK